VVLEVVLVVLEVVLVVLEVAQRRVRNVRPHRNNARGQHSVGHVIRAVRSQHRCQQAVRDQQFQGALQSTHPQSLELNTLSKVSCGVGLFSGAVDREHRLLPAQSSGTLKIGFSMVDFIGVRSRQVSRCPF
jgi:hypothetical protein